MMFFLALQQRQRAIYQEWKFISPSLPYFGWAGIELEPLEYEQRWCWCKKSLSPALPGSSHFTNLGGGCHKCQSSLEWCAEWVTVPWGWAPRQDPDLPHRPEVSTDSAWSLLQFDHLPITVCNGWIRDRVSGDWKQTGSQRFEQELCFCVHIWILRVSSRDVCQYAGFQSFIYPPLNCFSHLTLLWSSPIIAHWLSRV